MVETGTCQRLTSLGDSDVTKESSLLFEDLPQDFGTGTPVQQQDIPLRSIHGFAAQIWSKLPWMIGMLFFWHHHEMFLHSGKKLQESDYRVCARIKNSIEIPSGQGSLAASGIWQWIDNESHIRYPTCIWTFRPPTYHFEKGHHAPAAMRDWPVGGPQIGRGEDAAGQPSIPCCPHFCMVFIRILEWSKGLVHLQNFQFPGFWIIVDKLL